MSHTVDPVVANEALYNSGFGPCCKTIILKIQDNSRFAELVHQLV